jgi:outer membrane protein TolC
MSFQSLFIRRRAYRLLAPLAGALLALLLAATAEAQQPDAFEPYVREALRNNLSLQQQRLVHEKTEAAVSGARGMFLPSVTLDARYSEMNGGMNLGDLVNPAYQALNQITGSNQFPTNVDGRFPYAQETRVRVAQPLFQPAVIANYRIQKNLRELDGARLRGTARALAADVQLAYVNWARAQRVVDLHTNTLELVSEAVRVNEKLLANGKITPACSRLRVRSNSATRRRATSTTCSVVKPRRPSTR